jgi:hypothetical protein
MIRHDEFIHILRFLHFSNNDNALENNDLSYDMLWKLFDFMNSEYTKYYTLFKGRITLKNCIPKGHVSINLCKLCDMSVYTYDMDIYSGKDRIHVTSDVTVSHATVNDRETSLPQNFPCSLLLVSFSHDQLFNPKYAEILFELCVRFYWTTCLYIPEDSTSHSRACYLLFAVCFLGLQRPQNVSGHLPDYMVLCTR